MRVFSSLTANLENPVDASNWKYVLPSKNMPLPRGLYRLAFPKAMLPSFPEIEIGYQPENDAGRIGSVRANRSIRSGVVGFEFVLPETAHSLWFVVDQESDSTLNVKFTRLSSRIELYRAVIQTMIRRLGSPQDWPRLAHKAWVIFRQSGVSGLRRLAVRSTRLQKQDDDFQDRYLRWIASEEAAMANHGKVSLGNAASKREQPLISVIMPVFNPQDEHLREAIESVLAQDRSGWQLLICDDASTDAEIVQILDEYVKADPRISLIRNNTNLGIAAASNKSIEVATGEWLGFLDHDDRLAPSALCDVAAAFVEYPDANCIYTDEDKLDENGERFEPRFKSSFDRENLLNFNVVNHFAVYRTKLVKKIGGLRPAFDGAQDYDLALRVLSASSDDAFIHVPKILYQWRKSSTSTAGNPEAKPGAMEAGFKALQEFLEREKISAEATFIDGRYFVKYQLPKPVPNVSIIIPTRDQLGLLRKCVNSLLAKTRYPNFEIIIMDNDSRRSETLDWLTEIDQIDNVSVHRYSGDFNYSAINNRAAKISESDLILLLNNDIEICSPDWLEELVGVCTQDGVGAVGARLSYPDGTIQHAGITLNQHSVATHEYKGFPTSYRGQSNWLNMRRRVSAVTGACLLTSRELFFTVGGLDEAELPIAFNDVDYCLKLGQAGYKIICTPNVDLIHHESASRGFDDTPEKSERLFREMAVMKNRWGETLESDPWGMPGRPDALHF